MNTSNVPAGYRIVKNGNSEYYIQKLHKGGRFLWWKGKDWWSDYLSYGESPRSGAIMRGRVWHFSSADTAVKYLLDELRKAENELAHMRRSRQVEVVMTFPERPAGKQ